MRWGSAFMWNLCAVSGKEETCLVTNMQDECVWNDKKDWRKNTSRAEVNGLRGRIAELEAALREARGQSMHSMQSSNTEMEIGMPNVEVEAVGDNQLRSLWDSEPGPSAPRQQYQPVYEGEVSLDPLRRWSTTSVPPIGGTNGDTGKSPIVRAFEPAAIPIPPPAQPQRSYDAFDEDLDPNLVRISSALCLLIQRYKMTEDGYAFTTRHQLIGVTRPPSQQL